MFKRLSESDRNYKITCNINGHDIEFISADRYKELLSNYEKAVEALRYVIEHSQPNTYNNEKARQTLKELGEL